MNRAMIISKLRKLLGPNAAYRTNDKAPDADERAKARAMLPDARAQRDEFERLRCARRDELLANDAEYQRLKAAKLAAEEQLKQLQSRAYCYRITAGVSGTIFFSVKAEGDTWAEVFAKLEGKPYTPGAGTFKKGSGKQ